MTPKNRVSLAMQLREGNRVPLMCQLSIGHYFLRSGLDPLEVWCTSEGFSEALVTLQDRYRFDGILVNLPGRDPDWPHCVKELKRGKDEIRLDWKSGLSTLFPEDDNPRIVGDQWEKVPEFRKLDPDRLFYVEPWGLGGVVYPYSWDIAGQRETEARFPPYQLNTLTDVISKAGEKVSVHAEVFSPWSQFLELMGYEKGLVAIMDDSAKVKACLSRLTYGAVKLARLQATVDIQAILISSAFAGASFISREHYKEFVLPFERQLVREIGKCSDVPVYTHTCGSIGDRLDLMLLTGTKGIDTLDPPPLGDIDLASAKKILRNKAFIKGNMDSVNTLLNGSIDTVLEDAEYRLKVGKPGGGYILSSACSVAPRTPPENIRALADAVEKWGIYERNG